MSARTMFVSITLTLATWAGLATAQPAVKPHRVDISVTGRGFAPDKITVKKAQPITLAFTRKTDSTCAKQVVIDLGDGTKIQKELPLDKTVEVVATFAKSGELRYACGMDMVHGVLLVE